MRKLERERIRMRSEALKKAQEKYKKEKSTRVVVDLYPTDQDILDKLQTVSSKQGYIKDLIRADMEKEKDTQ